MAKPAVQCLVKQCSRLLKEADNINIKVPWGFVRGIQVGPRDAPPVLLVHGWLDNCYSFVPLLTQLPLDKRYIAIDLPGHGHSSHKPKSAYTNLLDYIVDLEHIRKALDIGNISLIGHSLGGMMCGIYTSAYPDRVDRTVAIDGLLPIHQSSKEVVGNMRRATDTIVEDTFKHKVYPDLESLSDKLVNSLFYHGIDREIAHFMLLRSTRLMPQGYEFTYDKRLRYPPLIRMTKEMLEPFAKAWKTPILYIEADEGFKLFNPVYPDSITLLDEAPTVQIAKMKGPHHIHMHDPEGTAHHIQGFLSSSPPDDGAEELPQGIFV